MQADFESLQAIYRTIAEFAVNYSFQIFGALLIIVIGGFVSNRVRAGVLRVTERHALDPTLASFLGNVARIVVLAIALVIALGKLGINIGPFVAAAGAISLGAGLAVQGLLSNYAAGLSIVISRPFVVGDTISVQGVHGLVKDVALAMTVLVDEDGVEIRIPNRHIMGEILHNSHGYSLIETSVGVAYGGDPQRAIDAIEKALGGMDDLDAEHPPVVGVVSFGDSGIDIGVRLWGATPRRFQLLGEANTRIFGALGQAGIEIPFPQREVRMLGEAAAA